MLGSRWMRPRQPGGHDLAQRLLWIFLGLEFLLAFPVVIHPGGPDPWGWQGFVWAGVAAVVALALLVGALAASSTNERSARALTVLGALAGICALLILAGAAYMP
jgi:hypothetical protein